MNRNVLLLIIIIIMIVIVINQKSYKNIILTRNIEKEPFNSTVGDLISQINLITATTKPVVTIKTNIIGPMIPAKSFRLITQIIGTKIGGIAMDRIGGLFAVCASGDASGSFIYISNDSITWVKSIITDNNIPISLPSTLTWGGISCDSTGVNLVASVNGGKIYISSDSGINFRLLSNSFINSWGPVAISRNYIVAVSTPANGIYKDINNNQLDGYIYYSTDSGLSWSKSDSILYTWSDIKFSGDGNILYACSNNTSFVYRSINYGQSWIEISSSFKAGMWRSLVCNFLGNIVVATDKDGVYLYDFNKQNLDWRLIYTGSTFAIASDEEITNITISNYSGNYSGIYTSFDLTQSKNFRKWVSIDNSTMKSFSNNSLTNRMIADFTGRNIIVNNNNKVYIINKNQLYNFY